MSSRVQEGSSSGGAFTDNKIRVGTRYQADVPDAPTGSSETGDMSTLVWTAIGCSRTKEELGQYLRVARDQYEYNEEQALGLLFWHKFDLSHAIYDLANYSPYPDLWSSEDKILFEQAMQVHSKEFHKIQRFLPDKSIGQLVNYFYRSKKRHQTSELDRKSGSKSSSDENSQDSHLASQYQSLSLSAAVAASRNSRCASCYLFIAPSKASSRGAESANNSTEHRLCRECLILNQRMQRTVTPNESGIMPPRGISLDSEELKRLACGEDLVSAADRDLSHLLTAVQERKQEVERLKRALGDGVRPYGLTSNGVLAANGVGGPGKSRYTPKWTNDEMLLAIQAFREKGSAANFASISELIKTKSTSQVSEFYVSHRDRFQLDPISSLD